MNKTTLLGILFLILSFSGIHSYAQKQPKVLVFSRTEGYRHKSIEAGIKSIKKLGKENHFSVTATEDADVLISSLSSCKAVIFLSTSGDILNNKQQEKFRNFIENGGGFIGIHGAAATESDWPWYGKLIGAQFVDHPKLQNAIMEVVDQKHPATSFLDKNWKKFDEWYNFKNIIPNILILLNLDENSYLGGKNGKNHPIAWFQEFEKSKMFYTGLGHTEESFKDPDFLKHLSGGILSVLNNNKTN